VVRIKRFIRVNDRIRAAQVRLIDPAGNQLGVVAIQKALDIAGTHELDLVEVAPNVTPPVCRVMDFSKFKYEEEKKERQAKKHQHTVRIKELRLKPHIDEHDYQTKLRHLKEFLVEKDKVKVSMIFRGREMAHQEIGQQIINRIIADSAQEGQVETPPKREGRMVSMIIAPK
jgi:translation initiation factor IF-3